MSYEWRCRRCGMRVRARNEGKVSIFGHVPKVYRHYNCIACGKIKERVR